MSIAARNHPVLAALWNNLRRHCESKGEGTTLPHALSTASRSRTGSATIEPMPGTRACGVARTAQW